MFGWRIGGGDFLIASNAENTHYTDALSTGI